VGSTILIRIGAKNHVLKLLECYYFIFDMSMYYS